MPERTTIRVVHETDVDRERVADWIAANTLPGDRVDVVDDQGTPYRLLESDESSTIDPGVVGERVDVALDDENRPDCYYHGDQGQGNATHVVDVDGDQRPVCRDLADEYDRRGFDVEPLHPRPVEP